ncbi:MAG: hypothetical protein O3C40_17845 [Planctomycetota bacterium]|nr:hypothetical protein [Planctomycetota bacterium]
MITVRFPDEPTERRALGFLTGRFSFTSIKTGETLIPEAALAALAVEGIVYTVEGPVSYGQAVPTLRSAPPAEVQ